MCNGKPRSKKQLAANKPNFVLVDDLKTICHEHINSGR